ncbi:hypothetical protein [Prochlorococcus sp. MIT 1011]|uniref:hypothetical protein n=1 Tax=Prochlorococcus sp. MIT 1011 TaxID=3082520 RepID=UPI0039B36DB6
MNEDLTTLRKIVQKTNTDVINQLHNLDERDRFYLLIEHMEYLGFPFEEAEVCVVPKLKK